ncbi:MAG TPA: TIGR02266 family protein [Polyangia bacterium]|nr:TIGR02266 family protein [Polyangia bacterium]
MKVPAVKFKTPVIPETRASRRVDLVVDVNLESEHNFYTGFSRNLSSGGLFVQTPLLRAVGSVLRVRFTLPGHEDAIESDAVVRWVREVAEVERCGMGMQFDKLPARAHAAIDQFIEQRDSLFYDD